MHTCTHSCSYAVVICFCFVVNSEVNTLQDGSTASPRGLPPKAVGALSFTMAELNRMTSNFSESHKIGQGGFGSVYKGRLHDGGLVAIKRAKKVVLPLWPSVTLLPDKDTG